MALCLLRCLLFSLLAILLFTFSSAQTSSRPKALVLPVTKDASTLQYLTQIKQRTPLVTVNLVVDLGGQFLWIGCENNYVSSTYQPARCGSAVCSLAKAPGTCRECFAGPRPGCNNNTCELFPYNSVTQSATNDGEVAQDVVSVQSTDGSNPGRLVSVSKFIFVCAPSILLDGLAGGAPGMAGLGRSNIGLPTQFASAFSFHKRFAICLSGSGKGVIFFGDGPYKLLPNTDASRELIYTPLLINPKSTAGLFMRGDKSVEYFIGINSIKIDDVAVSINKTLLKIDSHGNGGTKISTVNPYTQLETSIYEAFTKAYIKASAARNISRVGSVSGFDVCFSSANVGGTRVGPAVPTIDLVLQSSSVYWRIFGANSMVDVGNNVLCLGFVDAGSSPRTSVVIGGYQLEDNLLQFDLATSRLGFSSSLLFRQTTCANFNFTSNT
ncbi:Xylanase inhibitor, C-terminal [Dillenia turbinata]|uniref:Xylanase inhibitor, C-terminal n=1 Tax=Dillenia turbinata TaxID=194707 RepID=A0AAN8W3S7_9MAGN